MKAATQSCSGKKALSKFMQNLQKTPTKEPILWQSHRLETCNLTKKRAPHRHTQTLSYFFSYVLEFQEHQFSRTPLNDCFCSKYYRKLNISLVKKKMSGSSITNLITSLFKLLELLLEPYSK